ncbi:MAG TPA: PKD domain-containing protein, partial [Spirochaetota bacterium]|nr:PKD domain-containing protein [Spirochaetota bacterium]
MRPDEGEFEVIKLEGFSGRTSYLWDFGDGSTKKTDTGYATHNYFAREQKRFHSTFTVKVTVTDEKNASATARATIDFPNVQWISSQMGAAAIPISYNRFPVKKDGSYTVDVNMKNIHNESISFGDAEVEYISCDSDRPAEVRAYGAGALLSQTSIAGNAVANSTLTLAGGMMPKSICNATIKLKGSTQSGTAVNATLYLTIPVSDEDLKYKKHQVVEDPELDRKIQQAKKILGKDFVTVDELRTLEKEGKL